MQLPLFLYIEGLHFLQIYSFLKTMTKENNLEKSSQDYKKSQYGSWYKKNAENKKKDQKEEKTSLLEKLKNLFSDS